MRPARAPRSRSCAAGSSARSPPSRTPCGRCSSRSRARWSSPTRRTPAAAGGEIAAVVAASLARGGDLAALAGAGRRLREGVQVVLAGPPNVGKSSLFNALVGEDRVLVDAEAGTTRDVVTARVVRGGLLYVLHDTAGLREDGGRVEQLGMRRTEQAVAAADVVLHLTAVDERAVADLATPAGSAVVTVVTKCDTRPGAPDARGGGGDLERDGRRPRRALAAHRAGSGGGEPALCRRPRRAAQRAAPGPAAGLPRPSRGSRDGACARDR